MGKGFESRFLQRHTRANKHRKMLNLVSHQGNTNRKHSEIPFAPIRMAIIEKIEMHKYW